MIEVNRRVVTKVNEKFSFEQSGDEWQCFGAVIDGIGVEEIILKAGEFPVWVSAVLEELDRRLSQLVALAQDSLRSVVQASRRDLARWTTSFELLGLELLGPRAFEIDFQLSTSVDPYADVYGVWTARIEAGVIVAARRDQL